MVYTSSYRTNRRTAYSRGVAARRRQRQRLARAVRGAGRTGRRNSVALRNMRTGGLLGIEKKYLDTYKSGTTLTAPTDCSGGEMSPTGGCTGCLSAPGQGDSASNREGNKIVVLSALIQGMIHVPSQTNQSTADVVGNVFIALVMDTQTNGATLNSEDVFSNPSGSTTMCVLPNRNMSYTQRFKVLKIKRITVRLPAMVYDGTNIEQQGLHTPFKISWNGKMPVTFTTPSTTADVAGVTNNSLHVIAFTSNTDLGTQLYYNCRVRFIG